MVDTVSTHIIRDNGYESVIKLSSVSDGTGENAVRKIDVSTLFGNPAEVRLNKIHYDISGMSVLLEWDATARAQLWQISPGQGNMDFTRFAGIPNNAGAGKTGDIMLTTFGAVAGDTYSLVIEIVKG